MKIGEVVATALLLGLLSIPPLQGQLADNSVSIAAVGPEAAAWDAQVNALVAEGRLARQSIQDDTLIDGRTHERLGQYHRGVPVFGGQIVRQREGRDTITVFGRLYEDISIEVEPGISGDAALAAAATAEGLEATSLEEPRLFVLPRDEGGYVLAYRVALRTAADLPVYFVNARDGSIEVRYSNLQTQAAVGRGTGVFGDAKKVSAASMAGLFRAQDQLRPAQLFTIDFAGNADRFSQFLSTARYQQSDLAADSDNVWTDGAIVDAHVYQGWTYDYYFKRFGRRGLDDRNLSIVGIVHPLARADASRYPAPTRGAYINNAAYLGRGFMLYGDGDGVAFDYFAGGLDVVGHELTHGVTDFTSALIYRNESGALNEAFSDIMGAAIEFLYEPAGTGRQRADWVIGEDVTRVGPGYIRSLQNPRAGLNTDPDHYSVRFTGTADNGGVHINSGIINHAFYLAVAGGTNRVSGIAVQGVGQANLERMERIFYRAFTLLLPPSALFRDARAATLQAATELYGAGSPDRAQLQRAWDAVGVQ